MTSAGVRGEGFGTRKPVRSVGVEDVREGSSGRVVVTLPRVWAVAEGGRSRVASNLVVAPARVRESGPGAPGVATGLRIVARAEDATDSRKGSHRGTVRKPAAELAFYRKYTEAMLRRYLRLSMEAGRVPALLGREMFRSKVSSYRLHTFEDAVIFCLDIERCLGRLSAVDCEVLKRVTLQAYSMGEAAGLLGLSLRGCVLRHREAVDRLTAVLLEAGLLEIAAGRGAEAAGQ